MIYLLKIILGEMIMTEYCEICGEELESYEEDEGICKNCKNVKSEENHEKDEEYIDPGIT